MVSAYCLQDIEILELIVYLCSIIGYGLSNGICIICAGGTASPSGATAPCYTCSAGLFSPSNAGVCTPCPADTFAAKSGTINCSPCDPGQIAISGSTSCTLCQPGTYHDSLDSCSNCLGTGIATCGPVLWAANTWYVNQLYFLKIVPQFLISSATKQFWWVWISFWRLHSLYWRLVIPWSYCNLLNLSFRNFRAC